jgi:hypothetical protein
MEVSQSEVGPGQKCSTLSEKKTFKKATKQNKKLEVCLK